MRKTFAALVAIMLAAAPAMAQVHHGARADSSQGMGMMQGQPGMMQGGMMQMMHGRPGMMQGGMMQMMHGQSGMMQGMAMGPTMVLGLQESLDLTDNQITELKTLRDSAGSTVQQHMMQGMQIMRSASEQLDSDSPDLDAYEARFREAISHVVLAHTAMARAVIEARQVLTPEQRERLSIARQVIHEMQPGMMDGEMMDRGMTNHGGGNGPGA